MPSLPHADNQRRIPERPGARLSPALSIIVIAGLSALSWAVLMLAVLAWVSLAQTDGSVAAEAYDELDPEATAIAGMIIEHARSTALHNHCTIYYPQLPALFLSSSHA